MGQDQARRASLGSKLAPDWGSCHNELARSKKRGGGGHTTAGQGRLAPTIRWRIAPTSARPRPRSSVRPPTGGDFVTRLRNLAGARRGGGAHIASSPGSNVHGIHPSHSPTEPCAIADRAHRCIHPDVGPAVRRRPRALSFRVGHRGTIDPLRYPFPGFRPAGGRCTTGDPPPTWMRHRAPPCFGASLVGWPRGLEHPVGRCRPNAWFRPQRSAHGPARL